MWIKQMRTTLENTQMELVYYKHKNCVLILPCQQLGSVKLRTWSRLFSATPLFTSTLILNSVPNQGSQPGIFHLTGDPAAPWANLSPRIRLQKTHV